MDDISKELYEKIKKEFDKAIKSDSELNKISKTIESGSATYKEANEFTKRLTELLAKSVNKYANENTLPNGHFYQNIGDAVLEPLLRQCYEEIVKQCASVQKSINDMAKINIKPQEPEYDEYRSYEVVNRANSFPVYNEEAQKSTEKTMESTNYNYVDKSIQKNAEFQTTSGLSATVTRRYDGVGLHDGKQACQWCLSRAGSNVPYREAKQRGMFERHEGCGCTIEYTSAKGIRTRQYGKGSWFDSNELDKRIQYSQKENDVKTAIKEALDRHHLSLVDNTKEFLNNTDPGRGTIDYQEGYFDKNKDRSQELLMSKIIHNLFGGDLLLLNESVEDYIMTPDYFWLESKWDLKTVSTKNSIDSSIRKGVKQIYDNPGGIILNVTGNELSDYEIISTVSNRLRQVNTDIFPIDIILFRNEKLKIVLTYNK